MLTEHTYDSVVFKVLLNIKQFAKCLSEHGIMLG